MTQFQRRPRTRGHHAVTAKRRRAPRPLRWAAQVDRALARGSAQLPHTGADRAMIMLSRSANKSRLWWVIGLGLAMRSGPTRRGALRGVVAIAGASAAANLVGKTLFPRRRPAAEEMPEHRRLTKHPVSSSFPSGHAASAAAFATAVTMESPAAGLAVAPIAAAVAYSRVHTGVHWPSDIMAGALIGVGAAYLTRHWWPLSEAAPVDAAPRVSAPAVVDGEGILALVNPASGADGHDPTDNVRSAWPKAAVIRPDPTEDLCSQLTEEILSRDGQVRALAVAGGDGTVAMVASVAAELGLPLALMPAGTLNHFARDVGLISPVDADAATRGRAVAVDLADVVVAGNGQDAHRWFVNTASIGGYPEMVRVREKLEERHPKWPSAAIAAARTLRHARPLRISLNGERMSVWLLFVGNGSYTPKGFAPASRPSLDTGMLDVRYLRADLPYSRVRFVLAVLANSLNASRVYRQRDLAELVVDLLDCHRRVALDGEVGPLGNRFRFRNRRRALTIYRD